MLVTLKGVAFGWHDRLKFMREQVSPPLSCGRPVVGCSFADVAGLTGEQADVVLGEQPVLIAPSGRRIIVQRGPPQ